MIETTPLAPVETPAELAEVDDPRRPYLDRPVLVKVTDDTLTVRQHPARGWVAQVVMVRPESGPVMIAGDVPNRTALRIVSVQNALGSVVSRLSHSAETCTLESGLSGWPSEILARGELWVAAFPSDPENVIADDYLRVEVVMEFA